MSQSRCRYYILYIDDFSRQSWVFFLRSKTSAEICAVFREFNTMTELKLSTRISPFGCNNQKGEYDIEEFRSILKESGISFEPAPPYTQHENGVAERMIQTHNAKARAMILDSQLPWSLRAEAINTANYLHAQSPTSANKGVTPSEKLYGSKPTISHLCRFGCKAYRMLPAAQRHGKFASRAETVYMLGYVHDSTSIWRLWNTERQGVIQASNVRFDELVMTATHVESMISDPFEIAKLNTDRSRQVDAHTETSKQADANSPRPTDPSLLAADNVRLNTGRYNLQKRPRAVGHRTWVEEESDSADPVSYQNAVRHPRLGPKWSGAIRDISKKMES